MAAKPKIITIESEIRRLTQIYKDLPDNQFKVVQGLIVQAARTRVLLNNLWADIDTNGTVELFSQGDGEPYERERPEARQFVQLDKNYQAIIKQLNELTPPSKKKSKLEQLKNE